MGESLFTVDELSRFLKDTQNEIYEANPEGYYATYMKYEFWTWRDIVFWLNEDLSERRKRATTTNILDVGCAYGTLLSFCRKALGSEAKLHGIDFMDCYLLEKIRRDNQIDFQQVNIEKKPIPWDGLFFDIIFMTEVLEHFNFNPITTFQKVIERLATGGTIYLSTPDPTEWKDQGCGGYANYREMPMPYENIEIIDAHVHLYSKEELLEIFKIVGLETVKEEMAPGVNARHFNFALKKKEPKLRLQKKAKR